MEAQRREALIGALQDGDRGVRQAAALEQIEQRQDSDALLKQLAHSERTNRIAALYGLESVDSDAIQTALCAMLKDDDADVRAVAVQVVGRKGYPAALAELVRCLQDDTAVAVYAAQALAGYADQRLIPYYEAVIRSGDEQLQCACVQAVAAWQRISLYCLRLTHFPRWSNSINA
ncbi:MAG: HEAT repeat domain-containing protein [Desulfuromonas sp.]|nr:HEAT repeat domain-containing protein [Desulfuromonas sp.]